MKPFDLEAAMRGEPIITRDGRKAKFVAYEPEADNLKVVVLIDRNLLTFNENGSWGYVEESSTDLLMYEQPMSSINGYEFPEPVREPLEEGQEYWVIDFGERGRVHGYRWSNDYLDNLWLSRGLIQLTKEGAEAQYNAAIAGFGGVA